MDQTGHPGIVVVDERGAGWVDLRAGTVEAISLDHEQILTRSGTSPAATGQVTLPAPEPRVVDLQAPLCIDGPIALKVEGGAVLASESVRPGYVALGPADLRALDLLRRPRTLLEVGDLAGPEVAVAAERLCASGIVSRARNDQIVTDGDDPVTEPPASDHDNESVLAPPLGEGEAQDVRSGSPGAPRPALASLIRRVRARTRVRRVRPQTAAFGVQRGDRVPVIPLYTWGAVSDDQGYGEMVEPSLSIGMLFAAARAHDGGRLLEHYDLHRIRPDAEQVFQEWATDPEPAIFAFSDYLWNVDRHLDYSRRIKELSPESICVHGGPSVPKYEADAERFFGEHPALDVAVRGEGELTFIEILDRLDGRCEPGCLDRLEGVAGLTYRSPGRGATALVRTPDRARMDTFDHLPSPYLSGEFDDLLEVPWRSASVESNRGCPYGCTYCDWGSATLARIRKFELDRVLAELDWIMEHAAPSELHVADANFGIFARDVTIAEHVAELRKRRGAPYALTISLAKNTVKYTQQIIEILMAAGVSPITASAAVQTMDEHTLEVINRKNIKLEKYDELGVTFREQGIPLVTDLLMGLPGATVASFKNDLQHCFDREVTPRTMEIVLLPNSPMNEPAYRQEHQIVVDEHGIVVGASSFSRDDYEKMKRLRLIYRAFDHFGLLRHVLYFLQAERGLQALDVMEEVDTVVGADPSRYPLLTFVARVFDLYTIPPVGWEPFYDEVVDFLGDAYGLSLDSDLAAVFTLQRALMPTRGRDYPIEVELEHDYVSWRRDLAAVERGAAIRRSLKSYGPTTVSIDDPGDVRHRYLKRNDFPGRRSATTGNLFWVGYDWELASPLSRHLATNVGRFDEVAV